MARPKGKQVEADEPGGPGPWILTFSDCMTLLLCFFVLLLTFSSFEEVELRKFSGSFECLSYNSMFPILRDRKPSYTPPIERPKDPTRKGSMMPTGDELRETKRQPGVHGILDREAFRDRKVIRMSADRLFWGKGIHLKADARDHLGFVAGFMRLLPSNVIISVSGCGGDLGLKRAWAIMNQFVLEEQLSADRFSIAAGSSAPAGRLDRGAVVEITLLARSAYP